MSSYDDVLPYRYLPRLDVTAAERKALRPFLHGEPLTRLDYYLMGSEARHLMVGPAVYGKADELILAY